MVEFIAVIFSLISVYFSSRNNILTWPTGIIGIIFYAILFYNNQVIGNFLLQFVFLLQSISGWLKWNNINKSIKKLPEKYSKKNISLTILLSFIITYFLFIIESKTPILDGITTSLSIMALTLMAFKKVDSWYYWIIVDIIFIIFFIYLNLYISAITYFLFLILAIKGLKKWTQISKMG